MGMEAGILGSCLLDDASPAQKNTTGTVVVCMIPPEHTAVSCDDSCIFTLRQRSAHNLGPLARSACREKKNTPRKKKKKKKESITFLGRSQITPCTQGAPNIFEEESLGLIGSVG